MKLFSSGTLHSNGQNGPPTEGGRVRQNSPPRRVDVDLAASLMTSANLKDVLGEQAPVLPM